MGSTQEIPYDPEADQARMKEDEAWLKQEQQRAEEARRKAAEEKAAREAEEKRLEAEREKAVEEARRQAEEAKAEAREQNRSTNDKSVFVTPGTRIPGINSPPRPAPRLTAGGRIAAAGLPDAIPGPQFTLVHGGGRRPMCRARYARRLGCRGARDAVRRFPPPGLPESTGEPPWHRSDV